ncbi:23S rRNA (adenine(2030)-N(6))-methyltransferase RlmJ [Labrys wisconsinensis]|uniref:Ribosomal RNA large subunit methyltransferase J n=1 Tax=Labrys wisconsinensis TaxID=425677 RepID=A0ABU0JHE4_9HYPH|nr:23S rRNA (adenine(2030)-N(6))-methyltransferase RlmJ [Labrys wisconsinensis]MDQ0473711.1 23S rRNA (adenine2030-N6)-methyltransferase [Labrys wisconsinensis]
MNYRHAFHAGNFADVFKHIVFSRILIHLARKDTAFRVIDTHAGAGLYDLEGEEAARTGEWIDGVGRLLERPLAAAAAALAEPWLAIVHELAGHVPRLYPGSPYLAQRLTRPQDRLTFGEARAADAGLLRETLGRDRRALVAAGDGWSLIKAQLPPPERRGVVLMDPPFEQEREFGAILDALEAGLRRWATGIYAVWYPIKGRREVDAFARRLAALPAGKVLRAEIGLYKVERIDRLNGCGMAIVNPPWHLDEDLRLLAPALAGHLAREGQGQSRVEWLRGE